MILSALHDSRSIRCSFCCGRKLTPKFWAAVHHFILTQVHCVSLETEEFESVRRIPYLMPGLPAFHLQLSPLLSEACHSSKIPVTYCNANSKFSTPVSGTVYRQMSLIPPAAHLRFRTALESPWQLTSLEGLPNPRKGLSSRDMNLPLTHFFHG